MDKASRVCIRSIPHKNSLRPAESTSPEHGHGGIAARFIILPFPGQYKRYSHQKLAPPRGKNKQIALCKYHFVCALAQVRYYNFILLAHWRLRAGSPRGLEASSPSASSRLQSRFACALTLADLESTKSKVFLSFRTGPERTLGPGPLWTFPAPKEREERLPLLWKPPLPPRVQPHVWIGSVVQWGLSVCHSRITGAAPR